MSDKMTVKVEVEFRKVDGRKEDEDVIVDNFISEVEGWQFDVDETVYEVLNVRRVV